MNSQQQAPKETLETLLRELKLKSIEELIGGEAFNIDTLAKTTSLHPLLLREKITHIHNLLTSRPPPPDPNSITLTTILKKWQQGQGEADEPVPQLTVGQGDILQVLGRAGAGKSLFLNEIVVECLANSIEVLFLDGSNNLPSLLHRVQQETALRLVNPKLRHFSFGSQSELIMILHSVGEWYSRRPEARPWVVIDCLGRSEEYQGENSQASSTIEFKSAQKIRKLFFQLSLTVGAIVYSTKTLNLSSLFETIYKHEKHRPKAGGSCAKKWDNLANKTLCLDYARTPDRQQHFWLNSTKGFHSPLFRLKKYQ